MVRLVSGRCITVSISAFSAVTKFFTPSRVRSGMGRNGNGAIMFSVRPAARMLAFTCWPATSISFFCASMKASVASLASSVSSVFFIFRPGSLPLVALEVCFGDHVEELLLGVNEGLHCLAGHLNQALGIEALAGLDGGQPGVGLLAGHLQEFLLHFDEGIEAALDQVGHGDCHAVAGDALFYAGGDDFILPLRQSRAAASGLR